MTTFRSRANCAKPSRKISYACITSRKLIIVISVLWGWKRWCAGTIRSVVFLLTDAFIPQAEEAGLIGPLTLWVLESALVRQVALHQQGHLLNMAVNLSARNLHDMELPIHVHSLLVKTQSRPETPYPRGLPRAR